MKVIKLITILLLPFTFTFCQTEPEEDREDVQNSILNKKIYIDLPQGTLKGSKHFLGILGSYYSFKGIPYAEPPIGDLRFRAPQAHKGWNGTLNARNHGSECLQPSLLGTPTGSEDCLFLNVYTPDYSEKHLKPVMVFIHGGSFTSGSGNSFIYGPENFMYENVVIVTLNYRLGVLGFLSTGDEHAQGNYGLKDCIEGLHWVQKNIKHFGGDSGRVTIFGESAGGVLVNLLVISSAARGLFHGAISQSGVALSPWAFQPEPLKVAVELSECLGMNWTNSKEMVEKLRSFKNLKKFVKCLDSFKDLPIPRGQHPFKFAPCIENNGTESLVITESPIESLQKGQWNRVPYIIGGNSHESLFVAREPIYDPHILDKFQKNPDLLMPPMFNLTERSKEKLKMVYNFSNDTKIKMTNYINYQSDAHFHYPIYKTVKLMSSLAPEPASGVDQIPIFYYIFEYSGLLNYVKHLLLLDLYKAGAMHGDELGYLFRMGKIPPPLIPGTTTEKVRRRMIKMWTNFAASGNPTPEVNSLIKTQWKEVGLRQEYLLIGSKLKFLSEPMAERMKVWSEIDEA